MKKFLIYSLVFCLTFLLFIPAAPSATAAASASQFIIINKSNNQLAYYENNKLSKTFNVATGKSPELTPEGHFKIVNKIVNRPYYSGNIKGGDPKNPLGKRWLGLNARGTWGTTYAIHGNNNESSIGNYVSAGCIRMHNAEVEWLFDQVAVDTPVIITSSSKSFDSIAKANGYTVSEKSSTTTQKQGTPTLKKGNRGDAVKTLQKQLTDLGYSTGGIDGVFGPATDKAVRKFQKDKKLVADGVVGAKTWNLLNSGTKAPKTTTKSNSNKKSATDNKTKNSVSTATVLKRGSKGEAVKQLQITLTAKGYNTKGTDGVFGPATEAAVRKFQRDHKLSADGIAGPHTLKKLK